MSIDISIEELAIITLRDLLNDNEFAECRERITLKVEGVNEICPV